MTPADAKAGQKKCMEMYTQSNGKTFGYKKEAKAWKYNFHENMDLGRWCKSGLAVIDQAKNEMTCKTLDSVKTNLDGYQKH